MAIHITPDLETSLLIHSDEVEGTQLFKDSSTYGHTVSYTGAVHHDTGSPSKFGRSSMYFDGGGENLTIADHSSFDFGYGDFTIDFWLRLNSAGGNKNYISRRRSSGTDTLWYFRTEHGPEYQFNWNDGSNNYNMLGGVPETNVWHHLAIVRRGRLLKMYEDGIVIDTHTESTPRSFDSGLEVLVGARYGSGTAIQFLDGWLDEVRISKGIARWTSNFTPPTSPYANISTYNIDSIGKDISNKDIFFPSNPDEVSTDVAFGVSSNVGAPLLDVYAGGNVGIGVPGTPTNKFEVQTGEPSGSKFSISSGNDSYTKLLIHSDDTDGNTTFIDSSANSHVISTGGDPTHKDTTAKFGVTSILFDGSDDYLLIADSSDWDFSGKFTIDSWVRFSTLTGATDIIGTANNAAYLGSGKSGWLVSYYTSNGFHWSYQSNNSWVFENIFAVDSALVVDTWYHVAVVRDSSNYVRVFLNGVQQGSAISNTTSVVTTEALWIGSGYNNMTYATEGYLDEVHISKGIARWTSNFTPPTRPYGHELTVDGPRGKLYSVTDSMETHGSGSIFSVNTTDGIPVIEAKDDYTTHFRGNLSLREPFTTPDTTGYETKIYTKKDTKPDSLTRVLIHSDSTDGSTDFADSSVGHYITPNNEVQHSTEQSKFGASSMYFDGTGDYLEIADNSDWDWGTGDFTVDFWAKSDVANTNQVWIGRANTSTGHSTWFFRVENSSVVTWAEATNETQRQYTYTVGTSEWKHYAAVRYSGTTTIYVNGTSIGSDTDNNNYSTNGGLIYVGARRYLSAASQFHNGYIDEVRVSKGIARWTAAFTPPTSPHKTDANTVLLIHSDTTTGDTLFIDSSETISTRKTITAVGTARHDDAQQKFGATSMEFDGNSDYLTLDYTDFQMGTGEWTIDFWVRHATLSDTRNYISGNGNDQLLQLRQADAGINFELGDAGGAINVSDLFILNRWHHVAATRVGDEFRAYVDGKLVGTDTISGAVTPASQRWIGARRNSSTEIQFFYGHMDEFRVSKGIARWKSNFDPPKRPYPVNEDKLLIKSDDGVEKTVIAAEPHGVDRQGQVLKSTGEGGVQWQNPSVELWYEAISGQDTYNKHQIRNAWGLPNNMEVGYNFITGKAPNGFTGISAIKVGIFNIQNSHTGQGVRWEWRIAGEAQGSTTHTMSFTDLRVIDASNPPLTDTIYEADAFNFAASNNFEDVISSGDYFSMSFNKIHGSNIVVMGVGITWEF